MEVVIAWVWMMQVMKKQIKYRFVILGGYFLVDLVYSLIT